MGAPWGAIWGGFAHFGGPMGPHSPLGRPKSPQGGIRPKMWHQNKPGAAGKPPGGHSPENVAPKSPPGQPGSPQGARAVGRVRASGDQEVVVLWALLLWTPLLWGSITLGAGGIGPLQGGHEASYTT